ncbi:MAG TPA: Asp-tRNA(Asn)/Glu-tRNA(Gln) amidotransferase subunit GatC [Firmicutes bacterium]|jgi:aspartyl-tRNA(Asn)/glutamyl-tRNA(Gln) amidotransferase subunit C|nr:Asp-tRNA(Asn)/Glu-tRNA(Gln) amidotransferase subunit GatC [Bacillota bacterium]
MSLIDKKTVERVADLARLHLTEEEKEDMTKSLNEILEFEQKLANLDTDDVEPTIHAIELKNVMRKDKVEESLSIRDVFLNAPDEAEGFFKVPRIVELD